jgi:hypothetical protein
VPSYNLLSKLPSKYKSHSHSSFLLKLLPYTITLTNISSITRTRQTKHIKNKTKASTITEAFKEALKATVALKAVAGFKEAKAIANISYYLHIKRNVIFITS